jgi:hypothetical protein
MRILFFFFLTGAVILAQSCRTKTTTAAFDTLVQRLVVDSPLSKKDVVKLIKASPGGIGEGSIRDSLIQLNDSVLYTILIVPDTFAICSNDFIVAINKNSKKITDKFLYSDCDVDYSSDMYITYENEVIAKDSVLVTKLDIYQKKNRMSEGDDDDIDHTDTTNTYYIVSPSGQIHTRKK